MYRLVEFREVYDAAHAVAAFFVNKKAAALERKQSALGVARHKFVLPVSTRFLTRIFELARVVLLWSVLEQLIGTDLVGVDDADRAEWDVIKSNYLLVARDAEAIVAVFGALIKWSPSFGRESSFTMGTLRVSRGRKCGGEGWRRALRTARQPSRTLPHPRPLDLH